jgi:hypothetical protein
MTIRRCVAAVAGLLCIGFGNSFAPANDSSDGGFRRNGMEQAKDSQNG